MFGMVGYLCDGLFGVLKIVCTIRVKPIWILWPLTVVNMPQLQNSYL